MSVIPIPTRSAFWTRPDVEEARKVLDLWASCKRAAHHGAEGCPTSDAVFEVHRPTVEPYIDPRTGLWILDEEYEVRTTTFRPLPEPKIAELTVDTVLRELGSPKIVTGLLYFLYPRSGPYQQETEAAQFHPKSLFGTLQSRFVQRAMRGLWQHLHREFVHHLAQRLRDEIPSAESTAIA